MRTKEETKSDLLSDMTYVQFALFDHLHNLAREASAAPWRGVSNEEIERQCMELSLAVDTARAAFRVRLRVEDL